MKNAIIVAVSLLFVLVLAAAASAQLEAYSAVYTVNDGTVSAMLDFSFRENTSSFEWRIPSDAAGIETSPPYSALENITDGKLLKFSGPLQKLSISYTAKSQLEKTSTANFFISGISGISSRKVSVTVKLPEKATLKYAVDSSRSSVIPKTEDITTDGKSIIIRWSEAELLSASSILVMYEQPEKQGSSRVMAVALFVLAAVLLFFVLLFYKRKKEVVHIDLSPAEAGLTANLLEEEKKIVELLMPSSDGLWQKQLETSMGISKVRLSRKLRDLEEKGIIEKIPYGNANKIRLKKG